MIRTLAFLSASLLLAACAGPSPTPSATSQSAAATPEMPPAPLPTYRIGDKVTWSNGQTETVVAVDGEAVTWRDQDGNSFTSYRNFALPSLAWDYPETKAATEIGVAPDTLWPLRTGNDTHFKVSQRMVMKIHDSELAYHDEWGCRVEGTQRVKVALGHFETYKLRCKRYWQGSNVGEITWFYAPSLGRVVKRTWTGAKQPEELIAIGHGPLDPEAERVAARVRQQGLEKLTSGTRAVGRTGGIQAVVQPKASFTTSTGAVCRDFLQTIATPSARATTAGTACRTGDGTWRVVDRLKTEED